MTQDRLMKIMQKHGKTAAHQQGDDVIVSVKVGPRCYAGVSLRETVGKNPAYVKMMVAVRVEAAMSMQ